MSEAINESSALLVVFLANAKHPMTLHEDERATLASRLHSLTAEARESCPDAKITDARFVAHLAQHMTGDKTQGDDILLELEQVRAADLYLCCAACAADASAVATVDQRIVAEVQLAVRRVRGDAATADEVQQVLRERLLVGKAGVPAKIAQYSGKGSFAGWVRVAAVREANRLMQRDRREGVPLDTRKLVAAAAPQEDPELAYLKDHYRSHFKAAFALALQGLSPKDRNLLRYRYLDELNIDEIGAIHGTHRATAARWLARIRKNLLESTRAALMEELELGPTELDSVMRLIHSQLPASISAQLDSTAPDNQPPSSEPVSEG